MAAAPTAGPLFGASLNSAGQTISAPMQIVILLTVLTLLPAAIMSITPFLRIAVVLHFLRQALGTQSAPSNQVLLGLTMFLTILVMQPVATDMYHRGWEPMEQGELLPPPAFDQGASPSAPFFSASPGIRTSACSSKSPIRPFPPPPPTWSCAS